MLFKFDCKRFGGVVLIALLALLMSGCQSDGAPAPVANIGERGQIPTVFKRAIRCIRLLGVMA